MAEKLRLVPAMAEVMMTCCGPQRRESYDHALIDKDMRMACAYKKHACPFPRCVGLVCASRGAPSRSFPSVRWSRPEIKMRIQTSACQVVLALTNILGPHAVIPTPILARRPAAVGVAII